ncbi:MAG TPA: sigma factor-like helix-turn-helix DNA-binding protein [Solirubrobacteraceae bacterium]|nr:sigma factor-like helix-turn-helix DNA-binding protein [Solirubrobacteraceae bacterium]
MTELDRLPPDQRAVLSLVLDRGKSYGEVADLLGIPEQVVRDRAHAALDAMANSPAGPGQAEAPPPPAGRGNAAAGPPPPAPDAAGRRPRAPDTAGEPSSPTTGVGSSAAGAGARTSVAGATRAPLTASSRTGGALLLGAIVAIVVAAVILIAGGGGGKGASTSSTGGGSSTKSTTTASAGKPSLNKTIALTPLDPTLKASGTAYVLSQSGRHAFYVAARGLSPSSGFFYAVWLYNSPSSSAPLGRAPTVGSDGRMEGGGPLPTNAGNYHQLIITRETSTHPRQPGPIQLRGTFGLR